MRNKTKKSNRGFTRIVDFGVAARRRRMLRATPKFTTGFTLLETLLAIALFSSLILAPLSIASNGLSSAIASKERITAVALAQDALEQIRQVRDSNRLSGSPWLTDLAPCMTANGCVVDSINSHNDTKKINPRSQNGKKNGLLGYNPTLGLYGYAHENQTNDWGDSKFTRYTIVDEIVSGREARVTTVVSWKGTFSTKIVSVVGLLTNW